jgi:hypothetical protein
MLPVVDRQSADADKLAVVGSRQAQSASLDLHRASRKTDALQRLLFFWRLSLLLFQKPDLFLLLPQPPFQIGDITSVLGRSPLGLANLGLDFFLGKAADFFLQYSGDVGHGWLLCGIVESLDILPR